MLVERPASQTGGIQFITLKNGCPLLPKDKTGTGLILIADRHYTETRVEVREIESKRSRARKKLLRIKTGNKKKKQKKDKNREAVQNFTSAEPPNFIQVSNV